MKKILISGLFLFLLFFSGCSLKRTEKPQEARQAVAPVNQTQDLIRVDDNEMRVVNKDSFSIEAPVSWKESPALTPGVSLMMVNSAETPERPEVKRINFRSYFSISYATLGDNNLEEYTADLKTKLVKMVPSMTFSDEVATNKVFVDGREAKVFSADLNQQGVDFKFLMYVAEGKDKDVWMISLNTLPEKFAEYRDLFFKIATSFKVK